MFGVDSQEPAPEEVRDALAEITNVTAGNLKSLVCGHCDLSMPEVTTRLLGRQMQPQESVIARQAFICDGEPLLVTVLAGC